jgi:two-component system sensor histidine kinase KdpD
MDWCDPAELVENAAELAADGLTNHHLVIDSDPTLPMVKLDQALLEQCLSNLLYNAAAWSPQKSKIAVVVRLRAGELVFTVQDEGTGILAAELPHLFGTFYRGKAAKPGGAGLGLAIVDGFVRAHAGRVTAANRDPNGAEFQISIPAETLPASVLENLR